MVDEADGTRRHQSADGFTALPSGTVLNERFVIDSVLGAGGFGITYLARDRVLGRELAIKEHFPRQFAYRDGGSLRIRTTDAKTFEWARDRFVQEARTLARCDHPNVVRVIDYFEGHGTAYMALEYVSGQSFKSWLQMLGRPPTQAELDEMLAPLLEALEHVHGKGVLHRDIKPDNIIIRPDGKPCLIDFGAARLAIAGHSQTLTGIISPDFSPPEQHDPSGRGQREASDIYALGATLYRALTGQSPPSAMLRASHDDLQPVASTLGLAGAAVRPRPDQRGRPGDGDRPARAAKAEALGGAAAYRPSFLAGIDKALRVKISERPQSVSAWRRTLLDGMAAEQSDQSGANGDPGSNKEQRGAGPVPLPTPTPVPPPNWLPWALGATGVLVLVAIVGTQLRPRPVSDTPSDVVISELPRQQRLSTDNAVLTPFPAVAADPARALVPGSGRTFRDRLTGGAECAFCPEMTVVPAGTFLMGSPKSEPERDGDEGVNDTDADARLRVTIARPFAMGK